MNDRIAFALNTIVLKHSKNSMSIGDIANLVALCWGLDMVVELGTYVGTTTEVLAQCQIKRITTVDVFESVDLIADSEWKEFYKNGFRAIPHSLETVKKYLAQYNNVSVIQGLTPLVSEKFIDNSVDAVFIDADHSYEGVKSDFEAWYSKVKPDGLIIFHDAVDTELFGKTIFKYCNELSQRTDLSEVELLPAPYFSSIKAFRKVRNA